MGTTVKYKDRVVFTVENEQRYLHTAGKWLEANIELTDRSSTTGVVVKIGTKEEWDSQPDLIAEENTIYVYSDFDETESGEPIPAYKVGDGISLLIDLPYSTDSSVNKDYENLINKPSIESVTLVGNKNFPDLGLTALDADDILEILV